MFCKEVEQSGQWLQLCHHVDYRVHRYDHESSGTAPECPLLWSLAGPATSAVTGFWQRRNAGRKEDASLSERGHHIGQQDRHARGMPTAFLSGIAVRGTLSYSFRSMNT